MASTSSSSILGPPTEQDLEDAYRTVPASARTGTIDKPTGSFDPRIPDILPHEQVFQIQVGERLFKLSGASLSSDAPSYFTTYFLKHRNVPAHAAPTLYIDRSPRIFELIVSHLQGYYVVPESDVEFVYLLLDANYFHLPRLTRQLATAEIFVRIGSQGFRISRNIFSNPGDSPNFFSLGFSTFFGSEISPPSKTFKRPPPVAPPTVPHRSGDLFRDLLVVLQGSQLQIRDDDHRTRLLAECRYYRFLGLEQRLIAHAIRTNRIRQTAEIVIGLPDVRPKNAKFRNVARALIPRSSTELINNIPELLAKLQQTVDLQAPPLPQIHTIFYRRPYVDTEDRELVVQVKGTDTEFKELAGLFKTQGQWEVVFYDSAARQMATLVGAAVAAANAPSDDGNIAIKQEDGAPALTPDVNAPLNEQVTVPRPPRGGYYVCADNASIILNGKPLDPVGPEGTSRKRARTETSEENSSPSISVHLLLSKSQWRIIHVQNLVMLELLRAEGHCGQRFVNATRDFI